MANNTILLILLALVIAGVLSYFQYYYKAKSPLKIVRLLAFLRFLSLFLLLLLLINPIISNNKVEIVKTPLVLMLDNSESIEYLKATSDAESVFEKLKSDSRLKEKFDIQSYQFDSEVNIADSITFKGKQTNLDKIALNLKSNYKNTNFPTVLISDGNQTSGSEYVFQFNKDNKVYPIILGDTATFLDLKINQINANKYAFLKNKFPIEVFLQYNGTKNLNATFTISNGKTVLNKQQISFSASQKVQIINALLPADKIGLQVLTATISSSEKEKNTINNSKKIAIEVLDQRTEVAIVSSINHPDIGALKRTIESNAQRKVTVLNPNKINELNKFNALIIYQPNAEFQNLYNANKSLQIATFTITGLATNFSFLNQNQSEFDFKMANQKEDYLAEFKSDFNLFALENIGFENFPPLENAYGTITSKQNNAVLLSSKIRTIPTNAALLSFSDQDGKRTAFLFGENIWKWRAKSFVETRSFEKFDLFIDKIIQFLSIKNARKSLVVNHERFYNSGDAIEISAEYFNKNFELDEKARLTITVSNKKTKKEKRYDLLKASNNFKVNLDGLNAGEYNFAVKELNSNTSYSNSFEVVEFDIEKQFVNPDVIKLQQLASETNAKAFLPNQVEELISVLVNDESYKPIQKTNATKTPLIDFVFILVFLALSLALEWIVRKYNGLL
ncbi:MAG: hypothetical protein ACI9XR_000403 [Flavobacterium sp.]|jgi:hypothetical protein